MMYRNYEYDAILGDTAKCVTCNEDGPPVNDVFPVRFNLGDEGM